MTLSPCRLLAPLALLGAALAPLPASAVPYLITETRLQACAFAGFTIGTDRGGCVDRPGEFPSTGIRIDNSATAGPIPDPNPGSSKVAQAISNTHAQFGMLRINDLAGGIVIASGTQPLLYANAISRASFSDILTFRAPASMSTADFRATVADLHFGFSASTSPGLAGGSVELRAFARRGDSFNGDFRPGSGTLLAFANGSGVPSDPADRVLHFSLDNGTSDRFVKFALTLELSGDARMVDGSAEATAWLSGITFSRRAGLRNGAAGAALDAALTAGAFDGVTVTSASRELTQDPVTGNFGYLAAAAVPEPASCGLMALGLALLAWRRRGGGAAA